MNGKSCRRMVIREDAAVNILLTKNKKPRSYFGRSGFQNTIVDFLLDTVFVFVSLVELCMLAAQVNTPALDIRIGNNTTLHI